jgi:hypothetical protein
LPLTFCRRQSRTAIVAGRTRIVCLALSLHHLSPAYK